MRRPLLLISSFNSFIWVSTMCLILFQTYTVVHQLPLPCQVPLGPNYNMGDGNVPLLAGFTDTWHSLCPFKSILEQGSGIKTFDLLLTVWINSVFPQPTQSHSQQMRFSGRDLLPITLHWCPLLLPGHAGRIPPNSGSYLYFTTSSLPHRVSA